MCLVSAPEGIAKLLQKHPDVAIYTAKIDQGLTNEGYIYPGLGDCGDRIIGHKIVKNLRRDGETYFFFFYKGNYIKCPKTKDNKIRLLFLWKMV